MDHTPVTAPASVERLSGIESLRAYAASAIILFHVAWMGHAAVPPALSFVQTLFGFGVQLFFVVSGFSLAYGYWGKLITPRAVNTYYLRRLARIAPLFYAVLLFQIIFDAVVPHRTHSLSELLLNLTFTFGFVPHTTFGIVQASWTIGVEMIFYSILPAVLMLSANLIQTIVLLLLSIFVATQCSLDVKGPGVVELQMFLSNFMFFAYGILGFHCYRSANQYLASALRRRASWLLCGFALAFLILLKQDARLLQYFGDHGLRTTWDSFWGIPFTCLCLGLAIHPTRILSNVVTRYLGRVSYSLYLIHPVMVYYLERFGTYRRIYASLSNEPFVAFLASGVMTIAIVAAISTFTFRYIEAPGMRLGKRWAVRTPSTDSLVKAVSV